MLTRGTAQQNARFRIACARKFPIKGWHILTDTNTVVFCGKQLHQQTLPGGTKQRGITQRDDIREFLDAESMVAVRPVQVPLTRSAVKQMQEDTRGVTPEEHAWVRSTLGMLAYYADQTVWDMAAEVNMLAQQAAAPPLPAGTTNVSLHEQ